MSITRNQYEALCAMIFFDDHNNSKLTRGSVHGGDLEVGRDGHGQRGVFVGVEGAHLTQCFVLVACHGHCSAHHHCSHAEKV